MNNLKDFMIDVSIKLLETEYSKSSIIKYLENISILNIEYTSNGCYINLNHKNSNLEMEPFNKNISQDELLFDALELINKDKNLLCEISTSIIHNKIIYIEIWNKLGHEISEIPENYTLNKKWQ
ncbi:hypothetical protein [Empedobacter tilapiae]|uniref:hypothetical protein n=1 Tax=Empedobacter tilapiae TaxID=2491114 RepID=UPI0028D44EDE|nr:hypothetical protein [Empedobacter tilapiae]